MTVDARIDTTPLLRPIWNALSGPQAAYALGDALARRFRPNIGPLAAARDASPEALAALARLVPAEGVLVTLQADAYAPPPGTVAEMQRLAVQMIAPDAPTDALPDPELQPLGAADAADMLALARLTEPGPFAEQTGSLGQFWGVRIDGCLAAMAGERMQMPGFAEISGVCAHPDFRGRGLARRVTRRVMAQIAQRGALPFLHSYADNPDALGLYRRLGFVPIGERIVTALRRAG